MKIVVVVNTDLIDSITMETRRLRIPLEPVAPDSNNPNLSKYYSLWIKDSDDTEELCIQIIQILMSIPGVVAAYCKPKAELAGWKVQQP